MIVDPVIIIGAPRSGTSMLFHILRTSQSFWSLPSEAFHIWNTFCHPSLHNWHSEELPHIFTEHEQREKIIRLYEEQIMPAWFWRRVDHSAIWRFNTTKVEKTGRKIKGELFIKGARLAHYLNPFRSLIQRRLLDKSLNNCLRLELVHQVFPDAKFIYLKRNGLHSIVSLINGWLNPDRFFTFYPPAPITIEGYTGTGWKFVLPEGWRNFDHCHLVDLCTWQWKICHEKILSFKHDHPEKFMDLKLEDLIARPEDHLQQLAAFINMPYGNFSQVIKSGMPRVNKTPDISQAGFPFADRIPKIGEEIAPLMKQLGYG